MFKIGLHTAGHPSIPTFENMVDFSAAVEKEVDKVFSAPFIIKAPTVVQELFKPLEGGQNIVAETMGRWVQRLPGNKICNSEGKVVAPLSAAMGLEPAVAAFQKILHDKARVASALPSFNACMEGPTLYGYSNVSMHFEPSICASVRFQSHGVMKFILIPAVQLADYIGQDATFDSLRDHMRSLTEEDAIKLKEKGSFLYHGTLEPNMCLVIPPAFFMAAAASGESGSIAGLRETFLPRLFFESQSTNFQKLLSITKAKTNSYSMLELFMDVLAVSSHKS